MGKANSQTGRLLFLPTIGLEWIFSGLSGSKWAFF